MTVIQVPTYFGNADAFGKEEFDVPEVPVTLVNTAGARLILGTTNPQDMDFPDIQVERRPGGWCVFINLAGGDSAGFVYMLDDGRVLFQPELWGGAECLKPVRMYRKNSTIREYDVRSTAFWQRLDKQKSPIGDPIKVAGRKLRATAQAYADPQQENIVIDEDACATKGDDGTWIHAWVWVPKDRDE